MMDKKTPQATKTARYSGSSENVKPSRIAYWERRNRQKKHERRAFPGESVPQNEDESQNPKQSTNPDNVLPFIERRQFVDTYSELSPEARELALAIDAYKIHFHRRFISHEELLTVIRSLGYRQEFGP